jgi:hypothetical protein
MKILLAAGVTAAALSWNGNIQQSGRGILVSTAEAIIGRPLTPMSYAGVARRTTRRDVGYGAVGYGAAAVGAAAVGAAAVGAAAAGSCYQTADPYGRLVTVCQ